MILQMSQPFFEEAKHANPDLSNIGSPWTTEQENTLIKRISDGKTHEEISKEFGRTVGGIKSRLKQIACDMVELGKSVEYASEKTTIPIGDIKRTIVAKNNYELKKKEKVSKYDKYAITITEKKDDNPKNNYLTHDIKQMKEDIKEMKEQTKQMTEDIKEIKNILKKFIESVVVE